MEQDKKAGHKPFTREEAEELMATKKRGKPMCTVHSPKYCLKTGGLRCRKCGELLDAFGNEYKK